mgnify:CR=1 FL=1
MTQSNTFEIIGKPTEVVRGILMEDGIQYEIWRYFTKEGTNETVSQLLPRKPDKNMEIDVQIIVKNEIVRYYQSTQSWTSNVEVMGINKFLALIHI